MTISEKIKVLCVRANISNAELARRLNVSPQAFSAKLKRETFTVMDLEAIADAVGAEYCYYFELKNGERI